MKTRVQISLLGCALSFLIHLYLSSHYYALKFGYASAQSLCNVSEKFNCDAASASAYSALFGIPLSVWGMIVNGLLFAMILLAWLEWSEYPERLRRWSLLLSGLSLFTSLIMAGISVFLVSNYCLFCIALYVLSGLIFFAYSGSLREPFWMHFKEDLSKVWIESRSILASFIAIPIAATLVHKIYMQNYGDSSINQIVDESIADWEASPKHEFIAQPALVTGPSNDRAAMVISEFADFRCGHCKRASVTLDAFASAHPDIRFEFYNFPLDGACNEKIKSSDGISCRVAATLLCAENQGSGKGWQMHKAMFAKQEELLRIASSAQLDLLLASEVAQLGMNWESFSRCLSDPSIMDTIKAQAKQGSLVNVQGTPTVFANGRLLPRGQLLPVLQAARQRALSLK